MIESALACGECGAGLSSSDPRDGCACPPCGPEERGAASSGSAPASGAPLDSRPLDSRPLDSRPLDGSTHNDAPIASTHNDAAIDSAPVDRASRHDCDDAARIPLTEHAVLDLLRQQFAEVDAIFVHPYVPAPEEQAARLAYVAHLGRHEPILALYETQVLDASIHEGFVVTPSRVCWKNAGEATCSMAWTELDPDQIYLDGVRLYLGSQAITLAEPEVQDACANAFHILALSALPPRPLASGRILARDTSPHLVSDPEANGPTTGGNGPNSATGGNGPNSATGGNGPNNAIGGNGPNNAIGGKGPNNARERDDRSGVNTTRDAGSRINVGSEDGLDVNAAPEESARVDGVRGASTHDDSRRSDGTRDNSTRGNDTRDDRARGNDTRDDRARGSDTRDSFSRGVDMHDNSTRGDDSRDDRARANGVRYASTRDTSSRVDSALDDSDHSGLQLSTRRSATPPPPHTTSYFAYASHAQAHAPDCTCWHCDTPLYATAPQCSFCGAEPKPTGWLRTA